MIEVLVWMLAIAVAKTVVREWNHTMLTLKSFAMSNQCLYLVIRHKKGNEISPVPHGGVPGRTELVLHVSFL